MPSGTAHTTRPSGMTLSANIYNSDHVNHVTNVNAIWAVLDSTAKSLGAAGNGSTDDTAAITLANALPHTYLQSGIYDTTLARSALVGPFWGPGQIRDSSNELAGPWFSGVRAAPSSREAQNAVDWFGGDISGVQIAMEHQVTGADTLGHPATGYDEILEASAEVNFLYNSSGHAQNAGDADGRTAVFQKKIIMQNDGQGDTVGIGFSGISTSTRSGSTHVLANPNVICMNGGLFAGASGLILNVSEFHFEDNGFDTAMVGHVVQIGRTNSTGAKHAYVQGFRVQGSVTSTQPADVFYSGAGPVRVGMDYTGASTATGGTWQKAIMAVKADDRIYLNATAALGATGSPPFMTPSTGDDFLAYSAAAAAVVIVKDGTAVLQVGTGAVRILGTASVSGTLTLTGKLVTEGTASSGGTGFRLLRVPN